MSGVIQFDTSSLVVGGKNIAEASRGDQKLIYNESYTVIGNKLAAPSVFACYDLTVIGDLEAEEIEVRGNLCVIGNIKASRISCLKSLICSGRIDADELISNDITANNITCKKVSCTGSIIVSDTIDSGESLYVENNVMAGAGIIGGGQFSAQNAVATEFFEFDGDVEGKVVEMDTDSSFGEARVERVAKELNLDETIAHLREIAAMELHNAGVVDEIRLLAYLQELSAKDVSLFTDWGYLTAYLVELSYLDRISNLRDYLYIIMAKKILPKEITGYETLEHVFGQLLEDAKKRLQHLPFHADNVTEFAYSLRIVDSCERDLGLDKEEILDSIFQSVGIKYKTVKSFLG